MPLITLYQKQKVHRPQTLSATDNILKKSRKRDQKRYSCIMWRCGRKVCEMGAELVQRQKLCSRRDRWVQGRDRVCHGSAMTDSGQQFNSGMKARMKGKIKVCPATGFKRVKVLRVLLGGTRKNRIIK